MAFESERTKVHQVPTPTDSRRIYFIRRVR